MGPDQGYTPHYANTLGFTCRARDIHNARVRVYSGERDIQHARGRVWTMPVMA